MKLAIVTATLDLVRAALCLGSWMADPGRRYLWLYIVEQDMEQGDDQWGVWTAPSGQLHHRYQTPKILGVVPAFAIGVSKALDDGADLVACFHDDLQIEDESRYWTGHVRALFEGSPEIGLAGFGGATGLGAADIYRTPYDPMQLARHHFISNMRHAEAHGERKTVPQQVAVLDGFSLIGRREYWRGIHRAPNGVSTLDIQHDGVPNLFAQMERWGIVHHAYDAALGAFAKQLGWEVWFLPIAVHHHGGLTAVADERYHTWANQFELHYCDPAGNWREARGDQAYWLQSHRMVYELFRGVLPIRV